MKISDVGNHGMYKGGRKCQVEDHKKNGGILQKEKPPGCFQNFKYYVWEFCGRTTVHGFTYLGERGRTIPEKIWWLITIVVALYLCISLIFQAYLKWMNSPVIVTFATAQTSIYKIPFPGVTICPEVKTRKSRFNYTDIYLKKLKNQELTETEIEEFEFMSLVCDSPEKFVNQSFTVTDERALDFLMEVAPEFSKTVFDVQWRGKKYNNVTDLFSPILSSEGLCYTFNMIDRSEIMKDFVVHYKDSFSTKGKHAQWFIETGYSNQGDLEAYPRRTISSGTKGGLKIHFKVPKEDLDYACLDSVQGFKVIIHHPTVVPRGRNNYFRVPLGQAVIATIKPNMLSTSTKLNTYKSTDRQCYFSHERNLKYFKIYNQPNCLNECLVDFILTTCGCVMFYMQREKSTPMCGPAKRRCVENSKSIYLEEEFRAKFKNVEESSGLSTNISNSSESSFNKNCSCLPSCNSLTFEVVTSQAEWNWKKFLEIEHQGQENLDDSEYAMLTMFFRDLQFITSVRNELYGQTDFLASCGGLMGLFTGFSFISLLEIIYYLTLRLICNLYLFGRRYWSGSKELLTVKES